MCELLQALGQDHQAHHRLVRESVSLLAARESLPALARGLGHRDRRNGFRRSLRARWESRTSTPTPFSTTPGRFWTLGGRTVLRVCAAPQCVNGAPARTGRSLHRTIRAKERVRRSMEWLSRAYARVNRSREQVSRFVERMIRSLEPFVSSAERMSRSLEGLVRSAERMTRSKAAVGSSGPFLLSACVRIIGEIGHRRPKNGLRRSRRLAMLCPVAYRPLTHF